MKLIAVKNFIVYYGLIHGFGYVYYIVYENGNTFLIFPMFLMNFIRNWGISYILFNINQNKTYINCTDNKITHRDFIKLNTLPMLQ